MNGAGGKKTKKKRGRTTALWLILLLLLLLLLLLIAGLLMFRRASIAGRFGGFFSGKGTGRTDLSRQDISTIDTSTAAAGAVADNACVTADSSSGFADRQAIRNLRRRRWQDSAAVAVRLAPVDSSDSALHAEQPADPCALDTIPPWIFPDPSGGLHRRHVAVRLLSVERCAIEWRFGGEKAWRPYTGEPILITSDSSIEYTARDSCGNIMPPHTEVYRIGSPLALRYCPDDMEYIKVGETHFCIDRYEWPNKRGKKPQSLVSIYQARDSCFTAGKRLCSTDEWSLACGGAYGWRYPYGAVYEPRACNTQDTAVAAAGTMVECRGYFDVYDMSGNLAEWTNTPSPRNSRFYNVMGGFWDSGPQASCFEHRYSYFPQNRHNPVGFRCCRDADTARAAAPLPKQRRRGKE